MIWWLHLISDKLQILTYARHLWSLKSWYFWLATQTVALVCFKVIHVLCNDDESIISSGTINNMVVNLCLLQARYIMSTCNMIMLATFIFANREHHYHINMNIKLIACLLVIISHVGIQLLHFEILYRIHVRTRQKYAWMNGSFVNAGWCKTEPS